MTKRGILIADAGGTKSSWAFLKPGIDFPAFLSGVGINCAVGSQDAIIQSVSEIAIQLSNLGLLNDITALDVHFFGAGVKSVASKDFISIVFHQVFPTLELLVDTRSDLAGAALALFGNESGVACILGTGSASGLYDGSHIVDSIPSLGYVLGDEGSGAFLGKLLLNRYFKRNLPSAVCRLLEGFADMDYDTVIENVYRHPNANRYLASFARFIFANRDFEVMEAIIREGVKLFFENNVLKYNDRRSRKVRFVGGVAFEARDVIKSFADGYGLQADLFLLNPIEALANYYSNRS